MEICSFCGKPGGNVEHIIAQWLIKRMGAGDYPIVVAHRKEDNLKSRPAHGLKIYTTKAVCDKCNNGWMSQLEAWFQRSMGPLVEPTWPKLASEVAHIHEKAVGGMLSRGFWVRNGGQPPQWQEHTGKMAFKAVMQLNHLAIRVFRAPGAHPSYYGPNGRLPLRCYPESQNPYAGDFRFHDLSEFDRVLELETWLGA